MPTPRPPVPQSQTQPQTRSPLQPQAQPFKPVRAPSGASDDGFKAPSSPMVDPENGDRDRCAYGQGPLTPTPCVRFPVAAVKAVQDATGFNQGQEHEVGLV